MFPPNPKYSPSHKSQKVSHAPQDVTQEQDGSVGWSLKAILWNVVRFLLNVMGLRDGEEEEELKEELENQTPLIIMEWWRPVQIPQKFQWNMNTFE